MKQPLQWLDKVALGEIYSAQYWNDSAVEREKPFWMTDNDGRKLTEYLDRSGLLEEFRIAVSHLEDKHLLRGKILDVAAGVCWTSALLSQYSAVEEIDALEFSWHRINDIAPLVCSNLSANDEKIQRIFGSFYEIARHRKQFYDLVFMSQAFHHADQPIRLIQECDQALKDGGAMVLIGEHLINWLRLLKRVARTALYERRLTFDFFELFKPDNVTGDHYYRLDHYRLLFESFGYKVEYFKTNIRNSLMLIATKGSK